LVAARRIRERATGRHDALDRRRPGGPAAGTGLRTRRRTPLGAHPIMTRDYVLDPGFAEERKRLAGMESLWDPGSQALLEDLGIASGWRCLEVGAGGGSMVRWMADRGAHVTAIDIDTRFIDSLASDSIEVRRVDLCEDELPQDEFDLVHARLVLEDYDWSCYGFEGEGPGFGEIADVVMGFMAKAGFERDYGRRVVSDMEAAGLTDIRGEGEHG